MRQQRTTGAARARRAGLDRQHVSHLPPEPNPVVVQHAQERAQSVENRVADQITSFAGSMRFVSLEAIFLSTFVMISQNRADARRQVIADQQWQTVKDEDTQNQELLELSHQILELATAIHAAATPPPADAEGR